MADGTGIEWTHRAGTKGETWNPLVGCSIHSPGCTNCYAMHMAARIEAIDAAAGRASHYAGTTRKVKGMVAVWTGRIGVAPDHIFTAPLRWRSPRTVFVNSMSDLFHEDVPDAVIDRVFAVMALSPQHTFQVLTKRSARMREYVSGFTCDGPRRFNVADAAARLMNDGENTHDAVAYAPWPLPNVWLGVSTEDQKRANERIPHLLDTPAAIRFVSAEPLLGPIDLTAVRMGSLYDEQGVPLRVDTLRPATPIRCGIAGDIGRAIDRWAAEVPKLDWVIVGGESGTGARPMHPAWARSIRDQCADSGTAFFFKQWGEWLPISHVAESSDLYHPAPVHDPERSRRCRYANLVLHADGFTFDRSQPNDYHRNVTAGAHAAGSGSMMMFALGKKRAGRLLDGVEHNGFPHPEPVEGPQIREVPFG